MPEQLVLSLAPEEPAYLAELVPSPLAYTPRPGPLTVWTEQEDNPDAT